MQVWTRAEYYCVRGRGGIWSVTLRQRRAELGSFKLDLDSPGDTPHRISPLGQTWTRRSSLTLAWLDRQKMGEHFPNGTGMRPHFPLTPTPPHLLLTPHPPQLSPTDLTQLTKNCLGGGARWREKGRSSGGRRRFVCLCGWTLWTRSHASVLLHPRKHRLIPHSPRFGANQNKTTGRQTASLEVTSGIGRLVFLQLKTSPVANSCNELSYENCRSVQRSRSERKDESGSASSSAKRCFLDGTWWKMETMATGRCTRVS